MALWKTVAQLDELPAQGGYAVEVNGDDVALFRVDGDVYALENVCPHQGFPLTDGWLDSKVVTCPWHGWRFDVSNGECLLGGGNAARIEVRVENGEVQIKIED